MNPQNIMKKWIEGIHNITPVQQLHAKMYGNLGGSIGLIFALIYMFWTSIWYFSVFTFFAAFIQYIEFIGSRQQWKRACEVQDLIEEQKVKLKMQMEVSNAKEKL